MCDMYKDAVFYIKINLFMYLITKPVKSELCHTQFRVLYFPIRYNKWPHLSDKYELQ